LGVIKEGEEVVSLFVERVVAPSSLRSDGVGVVGVEEQGLLGRFSE
jgi:hypothetical protein